MLVIHHGLEGRHLVLLGEVAERIVAMDAKAGRKAVLGVVPVAALNNVLIVGQCAAMVGVVGGVVVVGTVGAVDIAEIEAEAIDEQKIRRENC